MRIVLVFAVFLALGAAAQGQTAPRSEGEIDCASPVAPNDTAASLKSRFAGAKTIRLNGPEGELMPALALFPEDKTRRLDFVFADARRTRAAGYYLPSANSKWTVAGIAPGASLTAVEAANGGPFVLSGFEWDNGGQIVDFRGGILKSLSGGCTLTVQFELKGDTPEGLIGDAVKIASTDKRLRAAAPKVSAIMVNFPARP
jgi:hypothetical protein